MKNLLFISLLLAGVFSSIVSAKDVSAYLIAKHIDAKNVIEKLKSADYQVLAEYTPVKNGKTIVFTNDNLINEGAKEGRAHASILRIFVDDKKKNISITNPVYFGRAFMQEEYKDEVFSSELQKLSTLFPNLKASIDNLDSEDISSFHMMIGMPYYQDAETLAKGSTSELLGKLKTKKFAKKIMFELKLSDSSTLIGFDLSKRTKKFIKKIGRANAAILPYCISIENDKATVLTPKYYLAISYPLLTMGEFMKISTVPGAILKDLQKPFK